MAEDITDYGSDLITKVLDALGTVDAVLPFITGACHALLRVNRAIGFALARSMPCCMRPIHVASKDSTV